MGKSLNSLYIFVKGYQGRAAYRIDDSSGNKLFEDVIESLDDKDGNAIAPFYTDQSAIIECMKYVRDNRGKEGIPQEPVLFIYTTYENIFDVTTENKNAKKQLYKENMDKFSSIKKELKRTSALGAEDDNVRLHFVPEKFKNHMDDIVTLLGKSKKPRRP